MQEEQFKIIYIFRENVLKLHVSHVRAQLTDVWVSKEPVGQTQVNIPVRNLFDTLERLENQQRQQSEMIRRMQLPHIELVYERLAQDYRQELLPVLDFLGVDNEVGLKTELRKITSDDLGQVIENYQEVADTLTSTKYEQYLT
jgi:LPS sulfotransferase NodH